MKKRGVSAIAAVLGLCMALIVTGCGEDTRGEDSFTVTVVPGVNGTITADRINATAGTTITLTITPANGYRLKTLSVVYGDTDVTVTGTSNIRVFTMPSANVIVSGEFELEATTQTYAVTITEGITNGAVTANPASAVAGTVVTLTITPAGGYRLKENSLSVTRTGGEEVAVGGNGTTRTFTMPASNVTVNAEFEELPQGTFTVSVSPEIVNGSVNANPAYGLPGTTIALTINPETGYRLKDDTLSVTDANDDAVTVSGSGNSYSFTMPASNVTVGAEFEAINYTVTVETMVNGSITASAATATVGTTITLTIAPDSGYRLKDGTLSVKDENNTDVTLTGSGNTRTFTMPASNVTVNAEFEELPQGTFTVSVSQEIVNGSVNANPVYGLPGTTITLTIAPDSGYRLKDGTLSVKDANDDAVTVSGSGNSYSFTMPASNVTVGAEFEAINYTVTVGAFTNGSITASVATATVGTTITLTIAPDSSYRLKDGTLSVKDENDDAVIVSGSGNSYSFTMPASNVTVDAEFEAINYTVAVGAFTNGSVTASAATATVGATITLTIAPDSGYRLKDGTLSVKDANDDAVTVSGSGNSYSFTMPASNVTVNAEFEAIMYNVNVANITNGSVTPNPTSASVGTTVNLTVTPGSGYRLKSGSVSVTGESNNNITVIGSGNSYSFTMPASNVTVSVEFERVFNVTISEGITGGTLIANPSVAAAGETITLTISVNHGFILKEGSLTLTPSVAVSGSGTSRTFTMPAFDVTANVEFQQVPEGNFTIQIMPGITNGDISANHLYNTPGTIITLNVSPNTGYRLKENSLSVTRIDNNAPVDVHGSGSTYSFALPDSHVTVNGVFEIVLYTITAGTIANGSVTPSTQAAIFGTEITLTINPNSGFGLIENSLIVTDVSGGNVPLIGSGNTRTFIMPASNVTISAEFEDISEKTINVNFTGFGGQMINLSVNTDYDLRFWDLLVVTINGDFDYVYWHLNGYSYHSSWNSHNEYEFSIHNGFHIGLHDLTAVVYIDDIPYSSKITFRVVR